MLVNFYANLRQIAGQKTIEFLLPDQTNVHQVVEAVVNRYPTMGASLLDENGELLRHVRIFVNGRDAFYLENALETILNADDKVDIFPAVAGGRPGSQDQIPVNH